MIARLRSPLIALSAALFLFAARDAQSQQPDLDLRFVESTHRRALAVLHIEYSSGSVATGTAFAVRKDGLLATSAHLLTAPDGSKARRMAVQFADSRQAWPARMLRVSADNDLALIKVDNIRGDVHVIPDYAAGTVRVQGGARVAIVGFPSGGEVKESTVQQNSLRRPILTMGVVTRVSPKEIELLGAGAPGSSGSPVFDQYGVLVGIVFGGRGSGTGHTLLATPVRVLYQLLHQ